MADSIRPYERLSRSFLGLNGVGTLWLGKDHILQVRNVVSVERYRRWYLAEIQSIVLRRTATRLIWNVIVGGGAALILLGAGAVFAGSQTTDSELMGVAVILGVVGLLLLAVAIVNTAMGPSCVMHIQTPHGFDKVAGPTRLRACERVIAKLTPLMNAVQVTRSEGEGEGNAGVAPMPAPMDQPTA